MKKIIKTDQAPAAIGPYSQAVSINGFLYVSGQIPVNPATGEIPSTIEEQTERVMLNLKNILSEAGLKLSNVVKSTIFIKDMNDFGVINEIYASHFEDTQFPARETVEVARLPKDVQIEISVIAYHP